MVASPAGRWLGAETDKSGKIMVEPDLSLPNHPEVFAIGDTAHLVAPVRNLFGIRSETPMLMPGVAQPAIQEGKYVAEVIRRRVGGRHNPNPSGIGTRAISRSSGELMRSPTYASFSFLVSQGGYSGLACIFIF